MIWSKHLFFWVQLPLPLKMSSFKASDLYLASIVFLKEKFNWNINALAEDDLSSVLYYLLDSPLARKKFITSRTYSISRSGLLTFSGKHPQNHWLVLLHEHWLFRGRQLGQAAWQNNIYCKQGLQRKAKESSLVSGKSSSQRKKNIYIYMWKKCCLWLCGFNLPSYQDIWWWACTCGSFDSSAVHDWSHIEHRWELGISFIYPSRDHQSSYVTDQNTAVAKGSYLVV